MKVIHIYGASGSGTSTIGEAIAKEYGHKHMDTDDYYWIPTNPPFTTKRNVNERISLMEQDIKSNDSVVISGSLSGWGDVFIPYFELAIRVVTPTEIRLERLKEREYRHFGNRILEHGDMFKEHNSFIGWASEYDTGDEYMRSKAMHDKWSRLLLCEQVMVDGSRPVDEILDILSQSIVLI